MPRRHHSRRTVIGALRSGPDSRSATSSPRRRMFLLAASLLLDGTLVGAQAPVRGVVFDSLRTGAAVAGAEVRLLGTALATRTDAGGRFEFSEAPASAVDVVVLAPWLDSLDLGPLRSTVPAASGTATREIALATPSFETYHRARCGTPPAPDAALLIGEVRTLDGEPGAATAVAARWTSTVVRGREIETVPMATIDTSRSSGSYSLCGVPRDSDVDVRAHGGGMQAGPLRVAVRSHVQRVDLVAGRSGDRTTIRGLVRTAGGSPLPRARVALYGDTARTVMTDSGGRFELRGVAARSGSLEVMAVGFSPALEALDPRLAERDTVRVTLDPLPQRLGGVLITANVIERERLGFEERRKGPVGYFITDSMLKDVPDISANVVASFVPRLFAVRVIPRPILMLRGSMGPCHPRFFIDGQDYGVLDRRPLWEEQMDAMQRAKRIEVYTASNAPPRFVDFNGCGVVVIWTR